MNIHLNNRENFYSERLVGYYRQMYYEVVDSLSHGNPNVRFCVPSVDSDFNDRVKEVLEAVFYGNPELFFVGQDVSVSYDGEAVNFAFPKKYSGENLTELWGKLDAELNRIAEKANAITNMFDRIHRVNKYLCTRVKPEASSASCEDAYGALILKSARCEGFAKAAKLIFDRVGVQSIIAFGEAQGNGDKEEHAWNIVRYKDNFYHFDFTWNAAAFNHGIPGQEYAFLNDDTAFTDHSPKYAYPACTDEKRMFWVKHNGLVVYHSDLSRIDIVPFGNNFLAIAKFKNPVSQSELDEEAFKWLKNELSCYNYASNVSYSFNPRLNVISFYFINE